MFGSDFDKKPTTNSLEHETSNESRKIYSTSGHSINGAKLEGSNHMQPSLSLGFSHCEMRLKLLLVGMFTAY